MNKYSLTVQHSGQQVCYMPFYAKNKKQALIKGEELFRDYAQKSSINPVYPISANFTGQKLPIKSHHICQWINDENALNAWGRPCGGYWKTISK
jgi:hypothetical protein